MWTDILIYKPLHIVTTFSWKKYYIESDKLEVFKKAINTNKFIPIKESILNTSAIECVEPASNDINQVENKLFDIEKTKAEQIRQEVYLRKERNKYKTITDWVLENIIKKFN
jgi:hypothetical protein